MFRAIIETQWKWTRMPALLATLLGFVIPLASLRTARGVTGGPFTPADVGAVDFVSVIQQFSVAYSVLAAGAGLVIALLAWGHDHRGRHVYALALPVPRWKYALMRFGAGAVFLAAPIAGVLVGTLIGSTLIDIPAGLHAYPIALTLRFAFAALVAYAIFFAISASTPRTAGIVLGMAGGVFVLQVLLGLASVHVNAMERLGDLLFGAPGVLSVFSGRWMLIDV